MAKKKKIPSYEEWLNEKEEEEKVYESKQNTSSYTGGQSKPSYEEWLTENESTQYDDIAPVKNTIETTQAIFDKYGHYFNSSDYEEYSSKGAAIKNPTMQEAEGWLTIADKWHIGGKDVGNIVTYSRENADGILMGGSGMVGKYQYRKMTDFEVGIYNYLLAKEGKESAQKFLDDIEETLNAREAGQIAENIQNTGAVASTILHGMHSVGSGLESFGTGIKQLFSEEALPTTVSEFTNQELASDLEGVSSFLYQVGNVIGNQIPAFAVGFLSPTVSRIIQSSSSAGSSYREALKEGKTKDEAAAYGVMMGGLEFATSKLLSGTAGMTGDIPKKALSKIASFKNVLAKVGAKYAITVGSEVTEEEVQLWLEPLARKIAFGEDYDAPTLEEMANTAIVTAISTGILNSGTDIATGNLTKVDGLTTNEAKTLNTIIDEEVSAKTKQQAINNAINKEIERRETEQGGALSAENKKAVRESVIAKIESGEIDISSEKLSKKDRSKIENEVRKGLDEGKYELSKLEEILSPEKSKRITELTEALDNAKTESEKTKIQAELNDLIGTRAKDLKDLAKGNKFLAKAVYETSQQDAKYKYDTEGITNEHEKALRESAKTHVNNTSETRKYVDVMAKLAKDRNRRYVFTNNQELLEQGDLKLKSEVGIELTAEEQNQLELLEKRLANATTESQKKAIQNQIIEIKYLDTGGLVRTNADGVETVLINADSKQQMYRVLGHETKHLLEKNALNKDYNKMLFDFAEKRGELEPLRKQFEKLYGKGADIDGELAAELTGRYLFEDSKFINHLMNNNTDSKVQQIINKIKEMVDDLVIRFKGTEQEKQLREVQKKFDALYKQTAEAKDVLFADGSKSYSIHSDNDILEENISKGKEAIIELIEKSKTASNPEELTIENAMYRSDLGYIDFVWGRPGVGAKFKHGFGLSHIITKRNAEGNDGIETANKLVEVIANASAYRVQSNDFAPEHYSRIILEYDGYTAVLSKDKTSNSWLLTGWENKKTESNAIEEVNDSFDATATMPTRTRHSGDDSVFGDILSQDTENVNAQFSLSNTVEEAKNLVALHNLTSDKLSRTMDLGGFPMPSIAVTRMDIPHTNFGDITLVMNRSTIDPKTNRKNTVYSADAWTPTVPPTQYKPNDSRLREISKKVYGLVGDRNVANALDHVAFDSDNVSSDLNRNDGDLANKYRDNDTMKYAFLKDIGTDIEMPTKEAKLHRNVSNEAVRYFSGKLVDGLQTVDHYQNMSSTDMMNDKELAEAVAEALNWDVLRQFEEGSESYEKLKANPLYNADDLSFSQIDGLLSGARRLLNYGIEQTIDGREASNIIRNHFNDNNLQEQYETWLNDLFDGVVEKTGIYNNKDIFTPSGNRRTFEQLHMPVTLDNIVKAMASQNDGNTKNVAGFNGVKTLRAGMAERFKSIDDMHKLEGRLQHLTEEEFDAIHDQLSERMNDVINRIIDTGVSSSGNIYMRMDSVGEILMEIADSRKYTTDAIQKAVNQYSYNIDESLAEDIRTLLYDVSQMPTNMFEAKPERAVGFDEVNAAILPNNVDNALRERLEGMGVKVLTYEAGNDTDRLNILNSLLEEQPDWKFSLSDGNDVLAPYGDLHLTGKDMSVKSNADIAPFGETVDETVKEAPVVGGKESSIPKSVRIADGSRGDELLHQSLENYPMQTVEQKIAEKIRAVEGELADNKDLRREAEANYNAQVAKLQERYASKKNKDTKEASKILQSISRIERLKASADADYAKRISDLEARLERMNDPKYSRAMQKQAKMEENAKWAADLLGDTSTWVDKKIGLQYATNTERRNLRDIVRDENGNVNIAKADAIDDALNGQYNRDEADKKRELAQTRQKYADMKITRAEDAYIQMLGEFRHNPDTTLTEKDVTEYYEKHKNRIDTAKVDKIIELARKDYDDWLNRVNAELRKQGMREIPYRQGYFPHFTDPKQNFIQKLFNWKTQDNEIPTSIAGLTETFKPTKSWQAFDKTRYSDETDYSFTKGFDTYSEGVLDWIYHMDTLQKRRAVENHIRFTHSEEGIQERIKQVYANEEMDANEAQAQIEHILSEAKNPLNNFVQDFTTHTNILAGKKNSLDRAVEQATNRHIYSVMTNVQNRISANMVLANVRSALTNFIPITQSWAQVSPLRSLEAVKDTIANSIKDDGMVNKSTFLTNRLREADKLYQTNWDKVLDKAGIMFEVVDNFSSNVIWRSKYKQNLAEGMSEAEAIKNADQFAENVMAGRSKGNEPTLFNAKNPLLKAFTMFQLEVNNQYGYLFKDVPNDLKAETNHWKLNLAKGYMGAFLGAYAYNALFSKLAGSDAAFDPIGIIEDLLRDLGLFDDDEEKEAAEIITNFGKNVVQEVPFVGGLFGGGRIPLSSALPYSNDGISGAVEDITEGNWANVGKEMMNPLLNVVLPVGGGQIKKTIQGLNMFSDEHPISGSYTDSGSLRFPVEDTFGNRLQAGIFGQYASENAREYFDNGYAPLKEKQIEEFIDVDIPIKDYWKYREGLAKQETNEDKIEYISGLDLPTYKKNILANNVLDRKEKVDIGNYDDFSSLEEFDFATKNPEKYALSKTVGGYSSYKKYSEELYDIKADKDEYGKTITGSRKEKVLDYINNLDADYETKIILYKAEYPSDDTYNMDIINYLNQRGDLTYEDRVSILTELGFRVTADGQIYAD